MIVNGKDSNHSGWVKQLKYRAWNYFLLHTPTHVIQFNFVDLVSNEDNSRGICPSNLIIFDKTNPGGTWQKAEDKGFICPSFNRSTLFDFDAPANLKTGDLQMSVTRIERSLYKIKLSEKGSLNLDLEVNFDYEEVPSCVYVTPLTNDLKTYFSSLKKPGLQVVGSYSYQGKQYECDDGGQCLMMMDTGRTHNPYGVAYFWTMLMVKQPNGSIVTINLHDGGLSKYNGKDTATDDFVTVDNKFYKIDLTRMTSEDSTVFVSEKHFKTEQKQMRYPGNSCDLKFTPI